MDRAMHMMLARRRRRERQAQQRDELETDVVRMRFSLRAYQDDCRALQHERDRLVERLNALEYKAQSDQARTLLRELQQFISKRGSSQLLYP